ncbi:gas vesicle protein GvpO [Actinomycetospora callitridis]|uniref:gas vesicle protein GvpO n=1 Tax=Actinomycetospora callitridis TaxID=913944 RepID=UPI0023669106|nr:gas vesicle protein GvpO [Actinomycetospora callitridis]MDD7919107.1 gas vesicle protein [Actinomycetospora callitridis]
MSEDGNAGPSRRRRIGQARSSAATSRIEDQAPPRTSDGSEASRRPRQRLGARRILTAAQAFANDLDWQWEALSGLRRDDDGWTVAMDVVETRRVPSTTDVIAVYEVDFDEGGELLGYRRMRHYVRGRGDNEQSR